MRDLVVRKMETILGEDLLNKDNETKKLFIENKNDIKIDKNDNDKDTEIINMKNLVDDYKKKLKDFESNYFEILDELNIYKNKGNKISYKLIIFFISIIILILGIYLFMR